MIDYIFPVNYKVTNAPSVEPVSLAEAKAQLRVTDTTEDDLITSQIQTSREWCEIYENRAYCTQTITAHFNYFGEKMLLPINPVISIDSITYIDNSGNVQTLDSSQYQVDNYSVPAFVYPAYGINYPNVRAIHNTITINYIAGYDDNPSVIEGVPSRVKSAIKLLVAHYFENREQTISGANITEIPMGVKDLLCERVFIR